MKVRWWPFDPSRRVASTRIRCLHVIDGLRALGMDAAIFEPGLPPPDVLVLSKRYDLDTLAAAQAMRSGGTRVVFDLCDNLFHAEQDTPAARRRAQALRAALPQVDAVTASTEAIADVVRAEVPAVRMVHVVGDAYEEPLAPAMTWSRERLGAEFSLLRLRAGLHMGRSAGATRLLWFGHHGSAHAAGGMLDLLTVMPALNRVHRERPVTLTVISNHRVKFEQVRRKAAFDCHYLAWDAATFSRAARLHQVSLLPIQINPFTVCKTNNRLATSLLHGLAVIADPIPSYREFENGACLGGWDEALQLLCAGPEARDLLVQRGLAHLRSHWGMATVARSWQRVLLQV